MLAYAPTRHRPAASKSTLFLIVSAHVAVVALALAATFEADRRASPPPIDVFDVATPKPPPPPDPKVEPKMASNPVSIPDATTTILPVPPSFTVDPPVDRVPPGPTVGPDPTPPHVPPLDPPVAKTKAVLKTAAADLRPPYPEGKRLTDQEASLRLRLSIDDRGRVVAVSPLGEVDRAFLDAARRHILRHWRYAPATEGGRPVHSTTTVTLQFELNG
jgi:protein TonB